MKQIFTILCVLLVSFQLNAQTIYSTDFGTTTSGAAPSPFTPTPTAIDPNITSSGWTGGNIFFTGVTGGAYSNSVSNGNGTYTLTLNINAGYTLDISTITFQMRRTATGPTTIAVNVAGTPFTVVGTPPNGSFGPISATGTATGLTGTITITITTSGGTGSGQNNRLDDFSVSGLAVLAIKLQSFQARKAANNVDLNWKLDLESGIANYEIEKSTNGTNFEKIGTVISQNQGNYNYVDQNVSNGTFYYRLKINETNGTYSYSPISKVIANGKSLNINTIYPSPAKNEVKLSIANETKETATMSLLDWNGKVVYTSNIALEKGITVQKINITNLKSGMYLVKIATATTLATDKFVKE